MKTKIIFAIIAGLVSYMIGQYIFFELPVSTDEGSYIFQAYVFKDLKLSRPYPPMATALKAPHDMLIMDKKAGWVSRYSPGHALWLLPGAIFNNPHIMKITACALSVYFMCSIGALLNIPILIIFILLMISPFYLFVYGTLFSHTSGFLFIVLMLWSYIKLRQTGLKKYAIISGLCWSMLFLNRTYTATLVAIPYALDAAIHFLKNRNRKIFFRYIIFASFSFIGVILYQKYNYHITGDSSIPTYLYYEPSESLGFGVRHTNGMPVIHSLRNGISNMKRNIICLDHWLFGMKGMLLASSMLALIGWSTAWSPLMLSSIFMIWGGYIFFWFSGPRHIGPAYYFETLPFIIIMISLGINKILFMLKKWIKIRAILIILSLIILISASFLFIKKEKEYFKKELHSQIRIMKTLKSAPKNSLIIFENLPYPQFGRISINEKGLKSDPLIVQSRYKYNYLIAKHFKTRTPFMLKGGHEDKLIPFKIDPDNLHPLPSVKINAVDMFHLTGENTQLQEDKIISAKIATDSKDEAHYMAYGGHHYVVPGHYVAHYHFHSINCDSNNPPHVDISVDNGQEILAKKSISGKYSNKVIDLKFEVKEFIKVEPRVYYDGVGDIALVSIEIKEDR